MNFAKGILESRVQTYKHLKALLKTIPLDTPTVIELRPGYEIRVTLLDANHCVGACMSLIEGQGNAILYTGDVRSEPWWVNRLTQNPVMIPYANCIKKLNCIYLDTTFASKSDRLREFPSKAEGLRELVTKVAQYPKDTTFYIESWTFGYENVWIALASLLESRIHLDRYRWGLYSALSNTAPGAPECLEAVQLCGFKLGNHRKDGCLTSDHSVRLHSCEKGTACPVIQNNRNVVRILPIVSRLSNGVEVHEMGIGGGKGDLDQTHELEVNDDMTLRSLMQLCAAKVEDRDTLLKIFTLLNTGSRIQLGSGLNHRLDEDVIKLEELVDILRTMPLDDGPRDPAYKPTAIKSTSKELPKTITFPYSRHSSYSELRGLVEAFRPLDVYPCTVDELRWSEDVSMKALFGDICSGDWFAHDFEMRQLHRDRHQPRRDESQEEYNTQRTMSAVDEQEIEAMWQEARSSQLQPPDFLPSEADKFYTPFGSSAPAPAVQKPAATERPLQTSATAERRTQGHTRLPSSTVPATSTNGSKLRSRNIRRWAYVAASGQDDEIEDWDTFGGLKCVKTAEQESQEL